MVNPSWLYLWEAYTSKWGRLDGIRWFRTIAESKVISFGSADAMIGGKNVTRTAAALYAHKRAAYDQGTSIKKEGLLPVLLIFNVIDVNKNFVDPVSVAFATN